MVFLKVILIIFIVIYLLGYLGKWLLFYWLKRISQQHMQQNAPKYKKEGEVTVNIKPNSSKRYTTNNAEYVDFEEIKD